MLKSMEEKGHEKKERVCPVCGKRLYTQLPDPDDIIGDSLLLDGDREGECVGFVITEIRPG